MPLRRRWPPIPQQQPDAVLDQPDPVSGTKYPVLNTTPNVRIIAVAVRCTWTVQPTPLEIHITIDGQSITHTETNPVSDDWHYAYISAPDPPSSQPFGSTVGREAFLYEGRTVKVEAEITGGTVSNLRARVKYAKY